MRLPLLGLLAATLSAAAAKPVEARQAAACTVTVGSCTGAPVELDLTECACACLQNSCDVVTSPCSPHPSNRVVQFHNSTVRHCLRIEGHC